ncbi:recombination protein NinB [Glaesserella parasuis]|nr:recombination protein NinB [Glaesserella parasuis]
MQCVGRKGKPTIYENIIGGNVETKQQFFLRSEQVRANCQAVIAQLPTDTKKPLVVRILRKEQVGR